MIFCTNEPCETEALYYYVTDKGVRFHLCFTCMEAFQLGQANADPVAILRFIENDLAVEETERDEEGGDE